MTVGMMTKTVLTTAIGIFFLSSLTAHAQTANVTAQGGPDFGSGYIRWDTFSCDLEAGFDTKPTPQKEATLTSDTPTWSWSSPGSGFKLTGDLTSDHVTLESTPNPSTKDNHLTVGQNSVTVTATAHWSDDKGNPYDSSPGSVTVTFFVREPTKVVQISRDLRVYNGDYNDPQSGSAAWGHQCLYHLRIVDNSGQSYVYGSGSEDLGSTIQQGPTPPLPPNMPPSSVQSVWDVGSEINPDNIAFVVGKDLGKEYGWTAHTLVVQFNQHWSCVEPLDTTPLNTHQITNQYQDCARNY